MPAGRIMNLLPLSHFCQKPWTQMFSYNHGIQLSPNTLTYPPSCAPLSRGSITH